MAYIGRDTDKISNVEVLDNITFNGSSSYTLQKGGSNFTPSSANTLLLSIDGVVQAGNFTVSGSTIDFGTAVAGTSTCDFILHYGVGLITTPSDGSVTEAKIGTGAVTSAKLASGTIQNQSAFKNIIINGDMSIDQRNSGSAVTTSSDYTLDRFKFQEGGSGGQVISVQQVSDAPAGFEKSAKLTTTTASSSITADAYNMFWQAIEGGNFSNANWGSSDAVQVTLSFWVKASIAGNYTVSVRSSNNGLSYVTPYTISSADTWEKKSLTIAAPTSGTFNVDNSKAIQVSFNHSMGSNYTSSGNSVWQGESKLGATGTQVALTNTVNSTWQITGVQLEIGTSASDFEFLPFDVNLQRCERYCSTLASGLQSLGIGFQNATDSMYFPQKLKQTMRATPSLNQVTGTNYYGFDTGSGTDNFNSITLVGAYSNERYIELANVTDISGTAGNSGFIRAINSSVLVLLEAEL
jgi:hypothetical protein